MSDLHSFGEGLNVAIVGASGGIGDAVLRKLSSLQSVSSVIAFSRRPIPDQPSKVTTHTLDIADEDAVAAEAKRVEQPLHLIFVATGVLHDGALQPEKTWNTLSADTLIRLFETNAVGPALVAKHFLPLLARNRKSAFAAISARVGSISDNGLGGWYGYRASKAALNQLLKTYAIELARKNPSALCVGLHPGTVDTGLSEPFQRGVPDGKLFTPEFSAKSMLETLDGLGPDHSGNLYAWNGEAIPF